MSSSSPPPSASSASSAPLSASSASPSPSNRSIDNFEPIQFAEWRVHELEKSENTGMMNEVLLMISQLFLGMLGEFETNTNTGEGVIPIVRIREFFGKINAYDSNNKVITFIYKGLMGITLLFFAICSIPYMVINFIINTIGFSKKFSSPIIIYLILVGFSFSQNVDGYRLIWLMITYILLYSRDLDIRILMPFILASTSFEIYRIVKN